MLRIGYKKKSCCSVQHDFFVSFVEGVVYGGRGFLTASGCVPYPIRPICSSRIDAFMLRLTPGRSL